MKPKVLAVKGLFFIAFVGYLLFLPHLLSGQEDNLASDDALYKSVTACMDLQYSLRTGWKPSDTFAAALYLSYASHKCGDERTKKVIALWLKFPHDLEYITLLSDSEIALIKEAKDLDVPVDIPYLILSNAQIKAGGGE